MTKATIPGTLLQRICEGAAERLHQHFWKWQHQFVPDAESPIEQAFLIAMNAHWCRFIDGPVNLRPRPTTLADFIEGAKEVFAEDYSTVFAQQVAIDKYRVDFLFGTKLVGRERPALYAVECDGHEFHEKTKEQAARDKSRDRELLVCGIKTLRFTGSEIWADPMRCVDEVMALIEREELEAVEEIFRSRRVAQP